MKRKLISVVLTLALLVSMTAFAATPVAADPGIKAITVPWNSANPSVPHYTYSGASVRLKGIARDIGTTNPMYRWDFGDGSPLTAWATITNPSNLGVAHTYTGSVGQLFIATLHVKNDDGGGEADQDMYRIKIYDETSSEDVKINMAIDEGLWYLHTTMSRNTFPGGAPGYGQPYGWWVDSSNVHAATGAAVDAFQVHGSKVNGDYDGDPYVETVQRALNYLLYYTYTMNISLQPAGDPDTNSNGIGLYTGSNYTYVAGICMVALASSGAPNRVAAVGGANVYGRTYADIVQDMVDYFAYGQVDAAYGVYRGGWRYGANNSSSDMSTTQWGPLGMKAAEDNMGAYVTVPPFVRTELAFYLTAAQNTALNNDNGGFAYTYVGGTHWYNVTKAGAGIICHEFLGTPLTDPEIESAIGFIYRHWNDTGTSWDHTKLHGNSYGMYAAMKAMRIPEPDILEVTEYDYAGSPPQQTSNSFDWYYTPAGQDPPYQGLATYCVNTQQTTGGDWGSWDDTVGSNRLYNAFATGWRVLILLKGVTTTPPVAEICDCGEQEYDLNQTINLDGSCSYHPDPTRSIVSYEWDLDNDGDFDDGSGVTATIPGGFPAEGYYTVRLRVTDDNPLPDGGPQTDIDVCQVWVHPPCHDPHADANGPYIGWVNLPVTFDGSGSWDPDSTVLTYEWDLDNDGLFGTDDDDCFGQSDDAVGVNPTWTWTAPYTGVIGLKVTDDGCYASSTNYTGYDVDYTTVEIGNHPPVSDPNGPYQAQPNATITLDGSGSYDPDPGDSIVLYEWDLDNDGQFDDATGVSTPFTVGASIGHVYDICLKVYDSYGEYDISCTTVMIMPPAVPSMNEWGMTAAMMVVAALGVLTLRRKRALAERAPGR